MAGLLDVGAACARLARFVVIFSCYAPPGTGGYADATTSQSLQVRCHGGARWTRHGLDTSPGAGPQSYRGAATDCLCLRGASVNQRARYQVSFPTPCSASTAAPGRRAAPHDRGAALLRPYRWLYGRTGPGVGYAARMGIDLVFP